MRFNLVRWCRRTFSSRENVLGRYGLTFSGASSTGVVKKYELRRSDRRLVVLVGGNEVGQIFLFPAVRIFSYDAWLREYVVLFDPSSLHELELAVIYQLLRPIVQGDVP